MKTQTAVFDELGRLLQSIGAAGQTTAFAYDGDDNAVSITDPLSNVTSQSFDALNRLIKTAAPLSSTISDGYDAHDNRTSVADPRDLVTSYVYDGLDNLIQLASPDTGTTVYVVDTAGNRTEETDAAGHVVQMSYDALDRLTAKTFSNDPAENITYRYDETAAVNGVGRLTSVIDEVGTTSYVYDARGNVVQETLGAGDGTTFVTAYAYDLANHIVQITYPSGRIVTYTRDAMGRIADVATAANSAAVPVAVVSNATYAPFGPLAGLAYGNSLNLSVQYDQDYQPSTRLVSGTATVQDLTYGFDADGNITKITDLVASARNQTFQYDALNRLSFANGVYGQLTYGYDAVGNRLSQSGGTTSLAESYTYAANSNELLSVANTGTTRSFTYSAAGNVTLDNHGDGTSLSYSYDQKNRVVRVSSQSAILATYDHDFLGRRMAKDLSGQANPGSFAALTVHFHYDRAGHLISEENQADLSVTEYIWLDDMPVGQVRNGTLFFVLPDHLGTPQKVTDASQNLVWDSALRPFGQVEQQSFTFAHHLRFPGQYDDTENKLFYNYFRDYDPSIGRYVESDPIGLLGGLNTYAYVGGSPVERFDALGRQTTPPPPPNISGGPWTWNPDPNNSRGGTWGGPGGASASWDWPGGHWDVDDGKGNRQRYDRWGNPLTPDEAHKPWGPKRFPLWFRGFLRVCPPVFLLDNQLCAIDATLCRPPST